MLELESRLIATAVVEALRAQGETPWEITVAPRGRGLCVRVALPMTAKVGDGMPSSTVVECHVPPGVFAYEQVAAALIQAKGRSQLETS